MYRSNSTRCELNVSGGTDGNVYHAGGKTRSAEEILFFSQRPMHLFLDCDASARSAQFFQSMSATASCLSYKNWLPKSRAPVQTDQVKPCTGLASHLAILISINIGFHFALTAEESMDQSSFATIDYGSRLT